MGNKIATLTVKNDNYSVFQIDDLAIKFYSSPYLEEYCKINTWDREGYIEYTGRFSSSDKLIDDSIDLSFIAKRLHLSDDIFKDIDEVMII